MLTQNDIIDVAAKIQEAAKTLHDTLEAGMAAVNKHNAEKGAKIVNAGPLSVALGCANSICEQLEKHVQENTPKAADAK